MAEIDSFFLSSLECLSIAVSPLSYVINRSLNSPYYIWLGRPRSCDVTQACHAFEIEGGNLIGNCSPTLSRQENKDSEIVPHLEIGEPVLDVQQLASRTQTVIDISSPLSSFHYQVNKVRRLSRS
jgi:betaine lipid synthase